MIRCSARLAVLCVVVGMAVAVPVPASAQFANWPAEDPPRPLPAREVKFPPYEVRTLANGMQVITVLHHEQPAVTMRLLVRAGAAQDPPKKAGVAFLTANLLDQGTTTRSAEQIADQIDSIGGAMGTGSGADLSFANAVVMKDSFPVAMNLLYDVVRNPAFSPEEIARQKEQAISSLKVNSEDPEYIANVLFDRLVYGFHPYGLPGSGTPETLAGVTREDLQAFHRTYFVPNNMILAIVGDVTSEEAFATAERVFGSWTRASVPASKPVDPPPPTRRVVVIDKPDAVQTEIRLGQLAIPRKHPDFLAFDLAIKILGGEGANRLHRVLRSERGLTYGASAETQAMKDAGDFVAETDTRTETTGEALRLAIDEVFRLQRQRVFERELSDAQAYLAGSFPLTIETPNDIATQVLNAVFYELPMQEIATFRERVLAVTPDAVQQAAQRYVHPDRLSIVLVGNARAFLPQLRAAGFADVEVIPIGDLDLMSASLKRESLRARRDDPGAVGPRVASDSLPRTGAAYRMFADGATLLEQAATPQAPRAPATPRDPAIGSATPAPATPRSGSAADLLRRAVEAKGGLGALKAVRSVVVDADTVLLLQQGNLTSTTKTHVLYPDKFRVDATVGPDRIVQIFNAGQAWEKSPAGVREAPAAMREDFAASVRRDTIPLLIAAAEGRLTVKLVDAKAADGSTSLQVLEISGPRLEPIRLFIDKEMRIARQAFSTPGPDGRTVQVEEVFSDYRLVNGVLVPFKAQLIRDGRPTIERTLTNVSFNTPLADNIFAKPQ